MDFLGEPLLKDIRKRAWSESGCEVMENATLVIAPLRFGVDLETPLREVNDPYFRDVDLSIKGYLEGLVFGKGAV